MNILIIYPFFNQYGLMHNFSSKLDGFGIKADVVCMYNLVYKKISTIEWPKQVEIFFKTFQNSQKNVINKSIRKLFESYCFGRLFSLYDMVDFHAYYPGYNKLMRRCIKQNVKFDITLWGSDIMRATDKTKKQLRYGFDHSYRIKMSDNLHETMLQSYGNEYEKKSRIVYFGNSDLTVIDQLKDTDAKDTVYKLYGNLGKKKIVVFGYNGLSSQNHEKMIDALLKLTLEERASIHVVIPMTYGGKPEYINNVRTLMDKTSVSYTILHQFLNPEQVATIRKTADIVVNVQNTDAIAASLQDHLYCRNVCIFGEWLNYIPYTKNDIYYIKTSMEDIAMHIKKVLHCYSEHKELCVRNHDKIKQLFSWESTIQDQVSVYGE